jgi:glutaconate CoA-transferase subunit A
MAEIIALSKAVESIIRDGHQVALEVFTHLIPHAAGQEIIRQQKCGLTLYRMTPDIIYDQMIGMGLADKLLFSWGGNPGVGSLHRFRDAVENAWPRSLEIEERSHADLASAYVAGAAGLPMALLRAYRGSDIPRNNERIKFITCPFSGEELAATPAVRPDVAVIHAQQADKKGNVLIWGIVGVQKEAVLAARSSIVTVEEIVENPEPAPNACVIPNWIVTAVCEVPGGDHPSYAQGYYERDNAFYQSWEKISRSRKRLGLHTKGPTAVITDLGILTPDEHSKELTLTNIHPKVSVDQVKAATGWNLQVSEKLQVTPIPNSEQLQVLRDLEARTADAHRRKIQ